MFVYVQFIVLLSFHWVLVVYFVDVFILLNGYHDGSGFLSQFIHGESIIFE